MYSNVFNKIKQISGFNHRSPVRLQRSQRSKHRWHTHGTSNGLDLTGWGRECLGVFSMPFARTNLCAATTARSLACEATATCAQCGTGWRVSRTLRPTFVLSETRRFAPVPSQSHRRMARGSRRWVDGGKLRNQVNGVPIAGDWGRPPFFLARAPKEPPLGEWYRSVVLCIRGWSPEAQTHLCSMIAAKI